VLLSVRVAGNAIVPCIARLFLVFVVHLIAGVAAFTIVAGCVAAGMTTAALAIGPLVIDGERVIECGPSKSVGRMAI
jgi:hypothetical protein